MHWWLPELFNLKEGDPAVLQAQGKLSFLNEDAARAEISEKPAPRSLETSR